ncbi:DUF58 domain-containing protein [Alteromonas oceanisediminis]|uniref:DUF58 domain-containing protein n=1 Tax=Alteromonas oceanisediminis TaxID=2836180 RepID=UPI001BD93C54|nr:DUF58 domain-containing protein [Alteromonas oceanisediminis]MBT0586634.1 DUF58 domain-containing protein [Alteromonas oceanisediminis]
MNTTLNAALLAQLSDLELRAKIIAQGALHGQHASRQRGSGVEFSQFRAYEPGDAMSLLDWKLFARSDRYYVREAMRESNLNIWAVLDGSASMLEHSSGSNLTKLQYAQWLISAIFYVGHRQGDAVGLLCAGQNGAFIPAQTTRQHYYRCLMQLDSVTAQGVFPDTTALQHQFSKLQRNALTVVVSDFYQQGTEIDKMLTRLKSTHTDVLSIQLETRDEAEFNFHGLVKMTERETGRQRKFDADAVRPGYLAKRRDFNRSLAQRCATRGITHLCVNIDEPIEQNIRAVLQATADSAESVR